MGRIEITVIFIIFVLGHCCFYRPVQSQWVSPNRHDFDEDGNYCIEENNDWTVCKQLNPYSFVSSVSFSNKRIRVLSSLQRRECYCEELWDKFSRTNWICPIICFPCYSPLPSSQVDVNEVSGIRYYDPRSVCVDSGDGKEYLAVRTCPDDFDNSTIRMLCEEQLPVEDMTMATVQMVTDEGSGITYYNKYCAECNKVQQVQKWEVASNCDTSLYLLGAANEDDLMRLVADNRSTCYLSQEPTTQSQPCTNRFYKEEKMISSCSDTELWVESGVVEDKCVNANSRVSDRVIQGQFLFKNIFCLVCNRKSLALSKTCQIHGAPGQPLFSFLFGLDQKDFEIDDDNKYNKSQCAQNQWKDPRGYCREVSCTTGKTFTEGQCQSAFKQRNLPYRIGLLLIPQAHHPISKDSMRNVSVEEVSNSIIHMIRRQTNLVSFSAQVEIQVGVLLNKQSPNFTAIGDNNESIETQPYMLPRFVWVNVFMIGDAFPSRDTLEPAIVNQFQKSQIVVDTDGSYSTSYQVQFIDGMSYDFDTSCNQFPDTNLCGNSFAFMHTNRDTGTTLLFQKRRVDLDNVPRSDFLPVFTYLKCPYVEFSQEDVQETMDSYPVPHVTTVELRFGDFAMKFEKPIEINQIFKGKDGEFYVCLDLIENRVPYRIRGVFTLFETVQYWLTIVCVSASMICLLATVTTYTLFPSLRCVAGFNTLGLSCSLMIAQLFLIIAGSLRGPSVLCTVMGLFTHYSWLVMFTWTFLCCLRVFIVFTGVQATARDNTCKQTKEKVKNLIISLVVPALIVAVVIATNMIMYNGSRIGYGYRGCVMDSPFAIYGPLIFVIVFNATSFVIVIYKIWKVRRLQEGTDVKTKDRKDFIIYMKLSTLTGMFWLLVILGEVFYNDIIRCVAIVANGCQGIFIFVSFITNHHVVGLYTKKFNKDHSKEGHPVVSSTSSRKRTVDSKQ